MVERSSRHMDVHGNIPGPQVCDTQSPGSAGKQMGQLAQEIAHRLMLGRATVYDNVGSGDNRVCTLLGAT